MRSRGGEVVLEGLMQEYPLTLRHLLERMREVYPDSEVVTLRSGNGDVTRASYVQVGDRVDRVCRGLGELGIGPGDRVATFMWNSQEHLELYLGVPCTGAVLHTLNIR